MPSDVVPLTDLAPGALATFHDAQLDAEAARLLGALGLVPACQLRVCQTGEPLIVEVRGTRIGLSRAVGQQVLVVPCEA